METTAGKGWTPADLLQLSGSYWATCALHAGIALDLFSHLQPQGRSAASLAQELNCDQRALSMLLDSLTALALVEKREDGYAATHFSATCLDRNSPEYLGHIIMHHRHLMTSWLYLDQAVKTGQPVREQVPTSDNEQVRESFLMGMFNLAMQMAPRITPEIDLSDRRRLLDLGGGPGTYAVHFCLHNPQLTAVVYDLPTTRQFAEQTINRFGLGDRIVFEEGDFESGKIEGGYDVAWLSHILHGEDPQGCAIVLRKAVQALEPGGLMLVHEFILDDNRSGPLFPALFSLNMLLVTPAGQAYSQGELTDMMTAAGMVEVRRLPLSLPNGAGVLAGRKA